MQQKEAYFQWGGEISGLGMIAVVIVGLGTYFSHRVIERSHKLRTAERQIAEEVT
ncbi:hypothetical protein [Thiolapillus sp.]|uniref:hypothetical protein n=1 Tax=Thiolapillus sp. TaxID=2017437 RepID=UPI003AF6F7AA